jgi:hypothetical protein
MKLNKTRVDFASFVIFIYLFFGYNLLLLETIWDSVVIGLAEKLKKAFKRKFMALVCHTYHTPSVQQVAAPTSSVLIDLLTSQWGRAARL